MSFKYKVRFFTNTEEECFAQLEDSVIPQINSEVYINGTSHSVENITYCYGDKNEPEKLVLVDVCVSDFEE